MANILKVFVFLVFLLFPCMFDKCMLVCRADMMKRRTLIELRQDVDFLRNLAIDFREEFDRINLWMKGASENITELLNTGHKNLIGDSEVTDTQNISIEESLNNMKRRMDILTSAFTADKATLRERTHAMSQQIQDGSSQLLFKIDQTTQDVVALKLFCKDESLALKSNLSDLNVNMASVESRLWKKVDVLSQQIKDGDSHVLSNLDQTNEKVISVESQVLKTVEDSESQSMTKIDKLTQSFEQIKMRLDQTSSDMINRISNLERMHELLNNGWVVNDYSYYKHFTNRMNLDSAKKTCEALGSSLVQGYDEDEMKFLVSKFGLDPFWLGASDREVEGIWRWLNGRRVTERNWDSGQPDNWGNIEDCMTTYHGTRWNDRSCGDSFPFVCKI